MFQTTRRKLALWYTAVTAILLLIFATVVYSYVRNTLIERIDDTLNHVVEVVERSLVIEPNQGIANRYRLNIEASFRDSADNAEDDHIDLEWFSPTGELLWSTLTEPLNIPIHPNLTGETVKVQRTHSNSENLDSQNPLILRQVTQRVQIGREVLGYLRVSHPWFEVSKPTRSLMIDLIFGTIMMVISVAASGWWLSGLAMKPVRESYQRLKQFTADASHELRNPIAMIQTNVQVALADPEPQLDQMKVIERLTRRLGRLVDDLLFLARSDSGIVKSQITAVPLDALLIEVLEEQQLNAAEKKIKLNLEINETNLIPTLEDEAFTLQGDWDQLARLFTNLISNALQYTPAGGTVAVELKALEERRSYPPALQVKIKDTGVGISETDLPHIFDRFYRADPSRSHGHSTLAGTGLGLAIAQAIVEHHQGQIQAESSLQQGTTMIVTLPMG